MKKMSFSIYFLLLLSLAYSQPAGYYNTAKGLSGTNLRSKLHDIIKANHKDIGYDGLYNAYKTTDVKANGKVWDMYSDVPNGKPKYEYTFSNTGSGGSEGIGYNREHSWPQSWFNEKSPMKSDIFHVYPTDSYVNNRRGSDPYGEVKNPKYTSSNGSKSGPCTFDGYTGNAFEPIDEYKGDLARTYFYMCTRYYTEDASWDVNAMVNKANLQPWACELLLKWTLQDTVSKKEKDRNDAAYAIQKNRNPFIDHPEWAVEIFRPNEAPKIKSAKSYGNKIVLIFSRYVEQSSAENLANYTLSNGIGVPTSAQWNPENPAVVTLTFANIAGANSYSLSVNNVKNLSAGVPLPNNTSVLVDALNPIEKENIKPEKFELYQNYPNPFNPTTKISFELSKASNISLKIFDIMGKEVRTLLEGYQTEGFHQLEFDASNLSSGVYFYQMKGTNKIITKQMMLVK